MLRNSVSRAENITNASTGRFLQVSGIRFEWNPALNPNITRVIRASVFNRASQSYEPVVLNKTYTVTTTRFVATGGDGYTMLPSQVTVISLNGPAPADMFIEYLANHPNVNPVIEGRILRTNETPIEVDLGTALFRLLRAMADPFVAPSEPEWIVDLPSNDLRLGMFIVTCVLSFVPFALSIYLLINRRHAVVVRPANQLLRFQT